MKRKSKTTCPVCFEEDPKIYPIASCAICKETPCTQCVAKLVTVCENGCGCASYNCPMCRGEVEFMIKNVKNVEILHGIISKFRNVCYGNNSEISFDVDVQ